MNVFFISVIIILFVLLLYLLVIKILLQKKVDRLQKELNEETQKKADLSILLEKICGIVDNQLKKIVDYSTTGIAIRNDKKSVVKNFSDTQDSARKVQFIVKDIADIIRIESNSFILLKKKFNLNLLLSSIFVIFYEEAKQKQIVFDSDFSKVPQFLYGDAARLTQVLINLLSNAIKYSKEKGTVIFKAQKEKISDTEFNLIFTVKDNGIGMTKEKLDSLFNYQAFSYSNEETPGLSLFLTKKIVDLMKGTLLVTSDIQEGTSFTIKLPFLDEKVELQDRKQPNFDLSKFKVIIADSDMVSAEYSQLLFRDLKISSDIVTSISDLKGMLKERKQLMYSLCLIDIDLFNIEELEQIVKDIKAIQDIAIVILSKKNCAYIEEEGHRIGIHSFIIKPLFLSSISNLVMSVLKDIESFIDSDSVNHYKGHKVLLAEDNEMTREIVLEFLSKLEISVDFVENGKDAVKIFVDSKKTEYSMIFMDITLPIIDGYQAIEMIRKSKHPRAIEIPIIAMDIHIINDVDEICDNSNISDFMKKPIQIDKMYSVIQKYLDPPIT